MRLPILTADAIRWLLDGHLGGLGLEAGERTELPPTVRLAVRDWREALRLVEPWALGDSTGNAVIPVCNDLLDWVAGHGQVSPVRLTAVYTGSYLLLAVLDGGSLCPDPFCDQASATTGMKLLKHALRWDACVPVARGIRATWALLALDSRLIRQARL